MTIVAVGGIVLGAVTLLLGALLLRARKQLRLLRRGEQVRLSQLGELERDAREAEAREERATDRLATERARERSLVHDRDQARAWAHELRRQLAEARAEAGLLGDAGDPQTLVLRIALQLLGAQKGLLLARDDGDGDGDLDLVACEGFDKSPEHSAIVQHLAKRTLSADETLRDNAPKATDTEIENLVAIPIYMRDRFHGVIVAANKPGGFDDYDDELLLALGDHASVALENGRLQRRIRSAYVATVKVLAEAIEAKDPFLRGHCDEVSTLVRDVAVSLKLGPKAREEVVFASLLHDIGKIGISERILLKPGPLTAEERTIVELHPQIGYRLVKQVPELDSIGPAILHHHERWDGRGYPTGLKGDSIPLEARLIAIADSFSAMISDRPYGRRFTPEEACEELKAHAGTQFDPRLVAIFCEHVAKRSFDSDSAFDRAFAELELEALRDDGPLLGAGAFGATDSTTLLYSHRELQDTVRTHAAASALNGRPFTVAVVELVDLRRINEDHGFAAGDRALREVALSCDAVAVAANGIAARLSGRRLAIVLPGMDEEHAARLLADLDPPHSVRVSYTAWRDGDGGADLIRRAQALGTETRT